MAAERDRIDELARDVADRTTVQWDHEFRSTTDERERNLLEQLQLVERIVDAHWDPPAAPERLGDFEIVREIGRGAMGVVYEARQISLDRHVAIKVLSAEMSVNRHRLRRFEQEAKALAALNHPNIVSIHSVEHVEGMHFISMELVEGQRLTEWIPESGMSVESFMEVAIQLADALISAHENEPEIIHRDLKPANIMVNREWRAKILDFGLAKLRLEHPLDMDARSPDAALGMTQEGTLIGTIPYMSPEQTERRSIDHRSDLFSLGVILYEMATGRRPFPGDTRDALISSIRRDTPRPVTEINPGLPTDLERIIAHCLRKNPEHRYQTAKGLRNELEELKSSLIVNDLRPQPDPPHPPTAWWRWIPAALVLLAAPLLIPGIRHKVVEWLYPPEPPRYLAVLPFAPLGDEQEDTRALSDGVAEVLTSKLTGLTRTFNLRVAPTTPMPEKPPVSFEEIEEIGVELGVDLAVVGSLLLSGEQARVTVSLVDLQDRQQLRAEVINTTLSDPFKFQDQLTTAVVEMLQLELPPRDARALRTHGTSVASAFRLYLQGRGYLRSYDQPEKVDSAVKALQQALEIDPEYAQAQAALGMAYWKKYEHDRDRRWVARASEACERSVELDQRLAEGHVCLGTVFKGTGSYGQAAAEFGWAISADPPLLEAFYGLGRTLERHGELDAAEEVFLKAIDRQPHYWAAHNWLGAFYWRQGRYQEAQNVFLRVVELAPLGYRGYQNLGGAYLLQGLYPDAIRTLEHSVALKPHGRAYSNLATGYFGMRRFDQAVKFYETAITFGRRDYGIWGNLGEANYWLPDKPAAREAYRHAVELAQERLEVNPNDAEVLSELAKYHAMLGDRENALECLGKALETGPSTAELEFNAAVVYNRFAETHTAVEWLERSRESGTSAFWIRDNPVFDNLRDDEKFQELMR